MNRLEDETLFERVERLERHNYFLKWVVLSATVIFLFSYGCKGKRLDVRQGLSVQDANGNARATLQVLDDGMVRLVLWDERTMAAAMVSINKDSMPFLNLVDEEGRVRVSLGLTEDGEATLSLLDRNGDSTFSAP